MYLHAPFPNTVYALDLNNDGKILWKYEPKQDPNVIPVMCCDTVNRGLAYRRRQDSSASGRHDVGRARRQDRRRRLVSQGRRSVQGRDRHQCADGHQGQGVYGRVGRRVRRARSWMSRLRPEDRQAGLARLFDGSGFRHAHRSGQDDVSSASRSGRIPPARPGRAINGRSAAARPGVGIPTIPTST